MSKCKCRNNIPVKNKWYVIEYKKTIGMFGTLPANTSRIGCIKCGETWRTKANYVENLIKSSLYEQRERLIERLKDA
jgi:hypothetical protein